MGDIQGVPKKGTNRMLLEPPAPVHNVYFVKYDVTVSFMAQVLDTVTYFVSHVLNSGYSVEFENH